MNIFRPATLALSGALSALVLSGAAHANADGDAQRAAHWNEIKQRIFPGKTIEPGDDAVRIGAPARAEDAALVPISVDMAKKDEAKELTLILDDNPTPYAAHFTFGPAVDPGRIKLRVRVDTPTDVHAVVATGDGRLQESGQFIEASGGWSTPAGVSHEDAKKGMGEMRMKFGEGGVGKPTEATLTIRHPNFPGIRTNPVAPGPTPARYVRNLDVTAGDRLVLHMDGDIAISANPVIDFGLKPEVTGPIKVVVSDNQDGRWEQTFNAPPPRVCSCDE